MRIRISVSAPSNATAKFNNSGTNTREMPYIPLLNV